MDSTTKTRLFGVVAGITVIIGFVIVISTALKSVDRDRKRAYGPPVKTTAASLCAAYEKDAQKADTQFLRRKVEVNGRLFRIKPDYGAYANLMVLSAPDTAIRIHCSFDDDDQPGTNPLHRGATVTILGQCAGLKGEDIHLEHCKLLDSKSDPETEEP
jgi:hypothetical protein